MCKIFSWDKNTEVIIYGAATQGGLVYNNIADQCNVIGFFDKRSAEIKNYLGLPVYLSDTNVFSFEKKKQLLVIVAIRNIFEHGSLVNVLVILGYENILFKPADNSIYKNDNIESQTFLSSLYDKVSNKYKLLLPLPCELPKTLSRLNIEWLDHAFVQQKGTQIIAYIPVIDIFTNLYPIKDRWFGNIPIAALFPFIEFFNYVSGDTDSSFDNYIDKISIYIAKKNSALKITDKWVDNIIHNTLIIYQQMNLLWELDHDFFLRNAPTAIWNNNGYFNLTSGKHRATFLVSKGCKFIPLSINQKDYKKYINDNMLKQTINYIENKNIDKLFLPIIHPYFYRIPTALVDVFYVMMSKLMFIFGKFLFSKYNMVDFSKFCVTDTSNSWHGIAWYLAKFGSSVSFVNQPTEFDEIIKALCFIPNSHNKANISDENSLDLIIIDSGILPSCWQQNKLVISIAESTASINQEIGFNLINFYHNNKRYSIKLLGDIKF